MRSKLNATCHGTKIGSSGSKQSCLIPKTPPYKNPASILLLYRLYRTSPVNLAHSERVPYMEKLKNLLRPSLVIITFAAITAVAGCGGHAASTQSAAVAPSPSPAPLPSPGTTNPSAKTIPDIQKIGGWQSCFGSCTGTPVAVFSVAQGVAAPSLSGSSARFTLLSGTKPFGGALWFKALGAQNSATHFIYDLNFYVDNPAAAQALEFNVTQSANGGRYNFSTQCDLAGAHTWRVWDPVGFKWVGSAATCADPPAKTWVHLVWEFERQPGGNVIFTAVTVDGVRQIVNLSMPHTSDSNSGVDVAYQSDANLTGAPYSVWLDKVSLTYW